MQQADHPLYTPTRQSPAAAIFILIRFLRRSVRLVWPLLIVIFFNKGEQRGTRFIFFALVIAAWQLVNSLIAYFTYFFHIENGELVVKRGLIRKTNLNIPLDRIQSINFNQSVLHQFFGVVSIEVDTAGASGKELALDALKRQTAEDLRELILAYKESLVQPSEMDTTEETADEEASQQSPTPAIKRVLFTRSLKDLLRIGAIQNHLRTVGILIGSILGLFQYMDDEVKMDYIREWTDIYAWIGFEVSSLTTTILISLPLLLLASFFISLGRTVLVYFNQQMIETDTGFKIIGGLLNRQELFAAHRKIQVIHWYLSPLGRLFGLYSLRLTQASAGEQSVKKSMRIPGCYEDDLQRILNIHIPARAHEPIMQTGISPLFVQRRFLYLGLLPASIGSGIATANIGWMGLLILLWLPLVYVWSQRYQKRFHLQLNEEILQTRYGAIGTHHKLIKLHKIQAIKLVQSPFQRRKSVANLQIFTAGGTIAIPYLPFSTAAQLRDYLLYKVEHESAHWM